MHYEPKTFTLPELAGMSKPLIETHLKLYEGYVKHTNLLINELARLENNFEENAYVIGELRKRLGFEFSGMRLHELYFESVEGNAMPLNAEHKIFSVIKQQFGGGELFLQMLSRLSGRGPGWGIIAYDPRAERLLPIWVGDHDIGHLAGIPIIIAIDHWEHAYIPDYMPADKGKYVDAYINNLNWDVLDERFAKMREEK